MPTNDDDTLLPLSAKYLPITGTGVHDRPESAFTIDWNECSRSTGIGVHDPPERAAAKAPIGLSIHRESTPA
jgi:hypothetical protein